MNHIKFTYVYVQVKETINALWKQQNEETKSQFDQLTRKLEQVSQIYSFIWKLLGFCHQHISYIYNWFIKIEVKCIKIEEWDDKVPKQLRFDSNWANL